MRVHHLPIFFGVFLIINLVACGGATQQPDAAPQSSPPGPPSKSALSQLATLAQKVDVIQKRITKLASVTVPLLRDQARSCASDDQSRFVAEVDSQAKSLGDADQEATAIVAMLELKKRYAAANADDKETPRIRDLEQRIDELDDQVRRTNTRVGLLTDTLNACAH